MQAAPEVAYSLHRKLAGAYLACIKLRARVPCRDLVLDVFERHQFGGAPSPAAAALLSSRRRRPELGALEMYSKQHAGG